MLRLPSGAVLRPDDRVRRREDLHSALGGQEQGGISTPAEHPVVLAFSGSTGRLFGYTDAGRTTASPIASLVRGRLVRCIGSGAMSLSATIVSTASRFTSLWPRATVGPHTWMRWFAGLGTMLRMFQIAKAICDARSFSDLPDWLQGSRPILCLDVGAITDCGPRHSRYSGAARRPGQVVPEMRPLLVETFTLGAQTSLSTSVDVLMALARVA
jgi:hypothetical protein